MMTEVVAVVDTEAEEVVMAAAVVEVMVVVSRV
jgi:hypothetical protein